MEGVLQLVLNGIMAGGVLALPAIGLTAIFVIRRYLNFALAAHMTVGAFAGYVANVSWGLPAVAAIPLAFLVAGTTGLVTDHVALKPLTRAGPLTVAIGSIALGLVLENVVRFAFAGDLRSYDIKVVRDWVFGPVRVGPQQVEDLAIAVVVMIGVFLFLKLTPVGKAMRAVGDNPVLADIKGIDPERMGRLTNFFAMGLAGVGGMLLGLETTVDPELGSRVLLSVFAAAVVGGLGSIPGAVVGALVIGIFEEVSLLVLLPTYRSVVGFAAIFVVLMFRPQGLFGNPGRSS